MKIIFLLLMALFHFKSSASGCGGPRGIEVRILSESVIASIDAKNYQIIAQGAEFTTILIKKPELKTYTLILEETTKTNDTHGLYASNVKFEDYDGCDDFFIIETGRYQYFDTRYGKMRKFSWPMIYEYSGDPMYPEYYYNKEALLPPFKTKRP